MPTTMGFNLPWNNGCKKKLKENVAHVTGPERTENLLFAWHGGETQLNQFHFRDESDHFTENIEIS